MRREVFENLEELNRGYSRADQDKGEGEDASPPPAEAEPDTKLYQEIPGRRGAQSAGQETLDELEGQLRFQLGNRVSMLGPEPTKRVHVEPEMPDAARRAQISGTVTLVLAVDREGNVVAAEVAESIPELGQAALNAVVRWKYEPADVDERRFAVQVTFTLEEDPGDLEETRSYATGRDAG